MTTTRRAVLAGSGLLTSAALLGDIPTTAAQPVEAGAAPEPAAAPLETAIEAYIYGYPLVTMEMTRRVMTNAEKPEGSAPRWGSSPMRANTRRQRSRMSPPRTQTRSTAPHGSISPRSHTSCSVPDEHGRYYLMPMLEGWTNVFADPGTRTTGTGAGEFAIVGPAGMANCRRASRNFAQARRLGLDPRPNLLHWHAGRLRGGARDPGPVQAGSAQRLRQALHAASRQGRSSIDMKTPVREQVDRMDAVSYFKLLADADEAKSALRSGRADPRTVGKRIGLVPGQDFDPVEARVRAGCPGRAEARRSSGSRRILSQEVRT